MVKLAFLADEHVPRAYVRALRSSGFTVEQVGDDHPGGIDDESLLEIGLEQGLVLVTNDRDFVGLAQERPHAGVVVYTDQGIAAGEFVGTVRRIDAHFSPAAVERTVLWLGQWMD